MIVGVLLCILLFALAVWVFQIRMSAERRREGLAEQAEEREERGEEKNEQEEGGREGFSFRGLFDSARRRIQEEMDRRRRQMEELIKNQRRRAEEERARRIAEEKDRALNALITQWRNLLASDFKYLNSVPDEIRKRLNAEILAATKRKQLYDEQQELERKRKARKMIDYIMSLVERLPDTSVVLEMMGILEGKDKKYDINLLKKHSEQPSSYVSDLIQLLKQQPINKEQVKQVAGMMNEFNCGKDEFCFGRTDQWLYAK